MENTAIQAVNGELKDGETTVGAEIHIEHLRASKVGETLTATAEVTAHEGSSIFLHIEVKNEKKDLIGRARHVRVVVDPEKFMARLGSSPQKIHEKYAMIHLIRTILLKVWKLWAALVAFSVTLGLFIPLIISVSTPRFYGFFSVLARIWSVLILFFSGFIFSVKGRSKVDRKRQYVVVSNHSSIIDIMLSYVSVPLPMMFIGKSSLARIPVFGMIYKASNILVERTSLRRV